VGTLRARTTGLVVLVTGLTLAAGGLLLVLALQGRLTASNDRVDRTHLRELAAAAATGRLPDPITDVGPEGVAQVVAADGTVLAASANITHAGPIADLRPGTDPEVGSVVAPDDDETEHYRLWAMTAAGPDGRPVTVYVGTSEEAVTEAGRTLAAALLVGVPLATALLGVATWLILGRALRRVDAIRVEVDSITGSELHRRVPASGVDDEVGRLATTMNRMLDRLEEADTRQRAFVADASHDLQSPLAAQRAQLEVALADAGGGEAGGRDSGGREARGSEVGPLARDLLAGTAEMERLVQDLLFLASDDDGAPPPPLVPLDLDDLVLEEATRLRPATGVRVDTTGVSAAPVRGDRAELRRLVRNLLENGARHAATAVTVGTRVEGDAVLLDVRDDGPGVDPTDAERVFDRFHRGDPARSRGDGTGLGLAIARTVARRHEGDLVLLPDGPGAHFALRLPVCR
jgi:signal transduction histidine kinase